MTLSEKNKALLKAVADATDSQVGYLLVSKTDSKVLYSKKLVERNEKVSENGKIATRITEAGRNQLAEIESASESKPTKTETESEIKTMSSEFVLEDGIPVPTAKRGRSGMQKYPFDTMQVGQSFFIPATEEKPNPAKSLASTVSSATRRYTTTDAEGNKVVERRFCVRAVEGGARVFRIEV